MVKVRFIETVGEVVSEQCGNGNCWKSKRVRCSIFCTDNVQLAMRKVYTKRLTPVEVEEAARMLSCLWTVSGPLLRGHKAQAGDGDWADDDGAEMEVDRKCVLHQPGNQWCLVGNALKG